MIPCVFREAVRAQKAEEGRQRRVHRARLLSQQQAAMTAQQSRLEGERASQIRSGIAYMDTWLEGSVKVGLIVFNHITARA